MSLFDEASLVITPNAFKAGKLYAVKGDDLNVVRATSATRVNANGIIETVAANVPRIDYSGGGCPSILVEPQRTNVQTYSEDFSNAIYLQIGTTVTTNAIIAPDGNTTADKIVEDTSTGLHTIDILNPPVGAGAYTVSVFVKAAERTKFQILGFYALTGNVTFDLTAGTATTTAPALNGKIENYGNGWFRCSATFNDLTGVGAQILFNILNNAGNNSYTGTSGSGLYLWGAQLELGSNSTSYIKTTTASVTRNADVISKTAISALIGQTEGTLYTEIKVNKLIGAASRYIFHLSDGTANNRIYIAFSGAASNVLRARIFNGGTLQCSINTSALTTTGTYKLALAYKNNDIVFYVNGVQIGTDIVATIPTCSRVDIGQNYNNVAQLSDNISLSTLFKTRLTNAELISLTSL
jgi:hypothetical protein